VDEGYLDGKYERDIPEESFYLLVRLSTVHRTSEKKRPVY
jgi:hypothetical protein